MYVYIKTEQCLWTVGHYNPNGNFVSESDHSTKDLAADRCHYLNGGNNVTSIQPVLLNFDGLAQKLDVKKSTLYELHRCGKLPRGVKIGKHRRFNPNEIDKWIEAGCPGRRKWEVMK
jgi:excisionase family DNA binding protein